MCTENHRIRITVLNLADFEFPMTLKAIPKFENLNNVLINVYSIEDNPSSKAYKRQEGQSCQSPVPTHNDSIRHFAWIKKPILVRSQIIGNGSRKYFCDR